MFKKRLRVKVDPKDKTISLKWGLFGEWVVYSGGYWDSLEKCLQDFPIVKRRS